MVRGTLAFAMVLAKVLLWSALALATATTLAMAVAMANVAIRNGAVPLHRFPWLIVGVPVAMVASRGGKLEVRAGAESPPGSGTGPPNRAGGEPPLFAFVANIKYPLRGALTTEGIKTLRESLGGVAGSIDDPIWVVDSESTTSFTLEGDSIVVPSLEEGRRGVVVMCPVTSIAVRPVIFVRVAHEKSGRTPASEAGFGIHSVVRFAVEPLRWESNLACRVLSRLKVNFGGIEHVLVGSSDARHRRAAEIAPDVSKHVVEVIYGPRTLAEHAVRCFGQSSVSLATRCNMLVADCARIIQARGQAVVVVPTLEKFGLGTSPIGDGAAYTVHKKLHGAQFRATSKGGLAAKGVLVYDPEVAKAARQAGVRFILTPDCVKSEIRHAVPADEVVIGISSEMPAIGSEASGSLFASLFGVLAGTFDELQREAVGRMLARWIEGKAGGWFYAEPPKNVETIADLAAIAFSTTEGEEYWESRRAALLSIMGVKPKMYEVDGEGTVLGLNSFDQAEMSWLKAGLDPAFPAIRGAAYGSTALRRMLAPIIRSSGVVFSCARALSHRGLGEWECSLIQGGEPVYKAGHILTVMGYPVRSIEDYRDFTVADLPEGTPDGLYLGRGWESMARDFDGDFAFLVESPAFLATISKVREVYAECGRPIPDPDDPNDVCWGGGKRASTNSLAKELGVIIGEGVHLAGVSVGLATNALIGAILDGDLRSARDFAVLIQGCVMRFKHDVQLGSRFFEVAEAARHSANRLPQALKDKDRVLDPALDRPVDYWGPFGTPSNPITESLASVYKAIGSGSSYIPFGSDHWSSFRDQLRKLVGDLEKVFSPADVAQANAAVCAAHREYGTACARAMEIGKLHGAENTKAVPVLLGQAGVQLRSALATLTATLGAREEFREAAAALVGALALRRAFDRGARPSTRPSLGGWLRQCDIQVAFAVAAARHGMVVRKATRGLERGKKLKLRTIAVPYVTKDGHELPSEVAEGPAKFKRIGFGLYGVNQSGERVVFRTDRPLPREGKCTITEVTTYLGVRTITLEFQG